MLTSKRKFDQYGRTVISAKLFNNGSTMQSKPSHHLLGQKLHKGNENKIDLASLILNSERTKNKATMLNANMHNVIMLRLLNLTLHFQLMQFSFSLCGAYVYL